MEKRYFLHNDKMKHIKSCPCKTTICYAKQIMSLNELLCDFLKCVGKVKHVLFLDQTCLYKHIANLKRGGKKNGFFVEHCTACA